MSIDLNVKFMLNTVGANYSLHRINLTYWQFYDKIIDGDPYPGDTNVKER